MLFLFFTDLDILKETTSQSSTANDNSYDDDEREVPSVVVYLVEPFSFGSDQPELQRLACLALLRCFQSVLAALPENIRNNVSVQVCFILVRDYLKELYMVFLL